MKHFRDICFILSDFVTKNVINVKYIQKFEVGCTTFPIMAKKYAAYTFILFCLNVKLVNQLGYVFPQLIIP